MDFDLTERQSHWRDRIRNFIEDNVRPAVPDVQAEMAEGDRWKVIQTIEKLKEKAKAQGL